MERKITKKKKVLIAVAAVIVIAAGISAAVMLSNPLKLQKETVNVEFGQKISTDAKDYLKKSVDPDIVKNTKVSYKKNPVDGQDYDETGEYKVKLKYKNKEKDVTVKVADTTEPQFNATADAGIDTIEGVELNFAELITASDLSSAKVTFENIKDINLNAAGEYTLKAVAKDKAGNKAKKNIKITVAAKPDGMSGSEVVVDPATGKVTVQSKTTYTADPASGSGNSAGSASGYNAGSGTSSGNGNVSSSTSGDGSIYVEGGYYGGKIPGAGGWWEYSDEFVWPEDWN